VIIIFGFRCFSVVKYLCTMLCRPTLSNMFCFYVQFMNWLQSVLCVQVSDRRTDVVEGFFVFASVDT
jgi:hypothetical protein